MKKIVSMLLAIAMLVTLMVPVMASEQTTADKELANAIAAVKQKIEIPTDLKTFNYYINSNGDLTTWNFDWSSDEGKQISVSINEKNLINRYYYFDNSSYAKKLPKYSKEQASIVAEKFINKIDSNLLKQYVAVEKENLYTDDKDYIFYYIRNVNGIKLFTDNISISVNKYSGLVEAYDCRFSNNVTFEDASNIISSEQAKKAFIDKLGLKMVYITKDDNKSSFLAYVPKYTNKYINAITGEIENVPDTSIRIQFDEKASTYAVASASYGAVNKLTPEELDAVKGMTDVMSKENADKKVRSISLLGIDDGFKLTNSNLNKGWKDDESFEWYLRYEKEISKDLNAYRTVRIDAKSGEILEFDINPVKEVMTRKTKEEAKTICDNVLKSLMPSKYDKLKYDNSYSESMEDKQDRFVFRFSRIENEIESYDNDVTITYDNKAGIVTRLSNNWNNNVVFEAPKETISIDKVYDTLFNKIGYEVRYLRKYATEEKAVIYDGDEDTFDAVLGYVINSDRPNIISATTGDILNRSGEIYKGKVILDYTDINGLKAENEIKILTQMGIKYKDKDNELKPKESLLQKDYLMLLCQLNDQLYFDDEMDDKDIDNMYNILISNGVITKQEKAPMSKLTREDAAKYFVRFLRYKDVAELKDIFKANFKDANKINPNLIGYVCIASGLKAMNGSNGYFNPKSNMTRLDGLLSIYSYLRNK